MYNFDLIQTITIWAIPVLLAVIVHEVAHGYIANLLGDKTALILGRLTLNPVKHINLFGSIILPILCLLLNTFIIGWAKPIPINPNNFKNYKLDTALVALAGPGSNLIMALLWATFIKILITLLNTYNLALSYPIKFFLLQMGFAGISINLLLMILNLIPIPPLDGSRILNVFLPNNLTKIYNHLEDYGFIILIILIYNNNNFINTPFILAKNLVLSIFEINYY
ncbi:MAG: site-2 protease family protein [Gammaproteobacteria bacterium]